MTQTKSVDGLTVEQERTNPQYTNLLGEKYELEQAIASAQRELTEIEAEMEPLAAEVAELKRELAAKEELQTRLLQELELKKEDYLTAEANYSQARRDLARLEYNLSLIQEPFVPDSPVAPNKKLNVAIAGILALMLGVFIIFMREYLKEQ